MRPTLVLTLALCAAVTAARGADDLAPVKETAVRLYDEGAYDEARSALEQLDAARALDGPLLYRLFFCEKASGHADEGRKALERAREALEGLPAPSRTLEESFYLANAYQNLGRVGDARDTAHEVTSKLEAGKMKAPKTAIGQFQVGKLYQDQGRQSEAASYYSKAVGAFDTANGRYVGNVRWALRFLGNEASARSDFEAAEKALTKLTALGGVDTADWDALAGSRVRLGKYAAAADAWRAAVKLDPSNADDPRYAARLADIAAEIGPLPTAETDGKSFGSMSQADLDTFLKSKSAALTAAAKRAVEAMKPDDSGNLTQALDPKLRAELEGSLRQTRKEFVAAGLEYALKRYGIRETAFREGYAVLIFQDKAWELPLDPNPPEPAAAPAQS